MSQQVIENGASVEIIETVDGETVIIIPTTPSPTLEIHGGLIGPKGEKGDSLTTEQVSELVSAWLDPNPISAGVVFTQITPAATWTILHSFARLPSVAVYTATGELVFADTHSTDTQVVITFSQPVAGSAVLF